MGRGRPPGPLDELTPRERDVLGLMAEGRSNLAIADHLGLTEKTVEGHVRIILRRLRPRAGRRGFTGGSSLCLTPSELVVPLPPVRQRRGHGASVGTPRGEDTKGIDERRAVTDREVEVRPEELASQ